MYDFGLAALAEPAARLGPRTEDVRRPLTELPENPNEALLANATAV